VTISGERARLAEERVELVQRLTEERGAQERARCGATTQLAW
jgi:hypothetical protein